MFKLFQYIIVPLDESNFGSMLCDRECHRALEGGEEGREEGGVRFSFFFFFCYSMVCYFSCPNPYSKVALGERISLQIYLFIIFILFWVPP